MHILNFCDIFIKCKVNPTLCEIIKEVGGKIRKCGGCLALLNNCLYAHSWFSFVNIDIYLLLKLKKKKNSGYISISRLLKINP